MAFFSHINNKEKTDYHKTSGSEEQPLWYLYPQHFPYMECVDSLSNTVIEAHAKTYSNTPDPFNKEINRWYGRT